MNKWFSWRSADRQDVNLKYQKKDEPDKQIEAMERYLVQLKAKNSPKTVNKISRKLILFFGGCTALAIGVSLFFLYGRGRIGNSEMSDAPHTKDTYIALENSYAESFDTFLSKGMGIIENLKEKNTHFTGNMGINFINQYINAVPKFSYGIDGYLTKDFISANLDLTLNKVPIVSNTYYTPSGSDSDYFYIPEYSRKPIKTELINPDSNVAGIQYLFSLYPLIKKYYIQAIEKLSKEANLTYKEDVEYKVGSLSSTCNAYQLTLTRQQVVDIIADIFWDLSKDKKITEPNSKMEDLVQGFFTKALVSLSMNIEPLESMISMTVYVKDNEILGRTIEVLDGDISTSSLFIGSLQVDNEYAFDIYEQDITDSNVDQTKLFNLYVHNFNHTYSGSFSYSNINGTFSKVKVASEDCLFPISGELNVKYRLDESTNRTSKTISLKVMSFKDKLQLTGSISYADVISETGASYYDNTLCVTDINITAEPVEQVNYTPPETDSHNVISNWEDLAKDLSDQPIENLMNLYCKAFNSNTRYTHNKAIESIQNGNLYSFIPDISSMLRYSINGESYYNIYEDWNNGSNGTIDYIGDYWTGINASEFPDIDFTDKNVLKNLSYAAPINTFTTTADDSTDKIIRLFKERLDKDFKIDDEQNQNDVTVYGNVFTGKKEYFVSSYIFLYNLNSSMVDYDVQNDLIYIQYDHLSGKILSIYAEFPNSNILPDDFREIACELAHIIDPQRTASAYLREMSGDTEFTGSFKDKTGATSFTTSSSPGYGENNEPYYIHFISLSRENFE